MSRINITGLEDIDDPFYRYKMDRLRIIRQKNKTVIENINKVCKDLKVQPALLVDFYKKKLGISMVYKDNILSTTANIEDKVFCHYLRVFIEEYILCSKCRLPETTLEKTKDKLVLTCNCFSFVIVKDI